MTTSQRQQQRSRLWNDMPYAALQLIADYRCVKASDALLVVGCVCKRWHDAAVNYLPADAWRRFYYHLLIVHHDIPQEHIVAAELPAPDTFQTFSNAARYWQLYLGDAQSLGEVFSGIENIPRSWSVQQNSLASAWRNCATVDENGRVTRVQIFDEWLQGSINLTKLPASLQSLDMGRNWLTGPVNLTQLPAGVQTLRLNVNQFDGSLDLTHLPAGLRELSFQGNKFSGSIDLTRLPPGLEELDVSDNKLVGRINLTRLPSGMQLLKLNHNKLSGWVDLSKLPKNMRHVWLDQNEFSGVTRALENNGCDVKVDNTLEIKQQQQAATKSSLADNNTTTNC